MYEAIDEFLDTARINSRDIAKFFLNLTYGNAKAAVDLLFGQSLKTEPPKEETSCTSQPDEDAEIQILEWNIRGLVSGRLLERTAGVVKVIAKNKPTIVMLQEVVPMTYCYLINALAPGKYESFAPDDMQDSATCGQSFPAIFVDSSVFQGGVARIVPLQNTTKARQLLIVEGCCFGRDITLMTAHFKRKSRVSDQREEQLAKVYSTMKEVPSGRVVIFGGDTNIRDNDLEKKLNFERVKDVWVMLGRPISTNNSRNAERGSERMYMKIEDEMYFKPKGMRLVGNKELLCRKFSSYMWGLMASFRLEPRQI